MKQNAKTVNKKATNITYVALGAVIISVCAFVTIPFTIPFTMQTFAVFAVLLVFGGKRGTLSILSYIALGAVGVPVFSGFKSGFGVLLGYTGGYIYGFIATGLIYLAAEYFFRALPDKKLNTVKIISLFIGHFIVCYFIGTLQFVFVAGYEKNFASFVSALSVCVFPYILPDLLKLALAFALSLRVKKFVTR